MHKLLTGIGAILTIFALSSCTVFAFVTSFANSADVALNRVDPTRNLALRTQFRLDDADDVGGNYVMDRDPAHWSSYLKTFGAEVAAVDDALPRLQQAAETPTEHETLDAFGAWLRDYKAADERAFALKRAGRYDAAVKAFVAFDTNKGQQLIARFVDSVAARASAAANAVEANSHAARLASIAGALIAIVAGTIIAFSLGNTISQRLKTVTTSIEEVVRDDIPLLSGAMGRFAAGDLSARVTSTREPVVLADKDETALLAMSYNNLVYGVKAFGAELSTTGEALGAVIGDVKRAVDAAADGDFSIRLETQHQRGVFKELGENLNRLMDVVSQTVSEIKDAAEIVSLSSREISAGNVDLSQRTEEQASSLEETAASMEQLTATVRQNAANANQANELAIGASSIATKGGDVVGEVVNTMAAINDSGKKIVDIIAVIDGIAFQTNILALNAAVEAARAGEQGRGFAVVAGEVRTLAQRSAAAAKEIKQLIGDSVEKTNAGTHLVGKAGETMAEIVTSVKRVTGIMSAIAMASAEQDAGIGQVNQAVAQMDTVTQQNAALVEEIAASSSALEERARGLVDFVSVFKVASPRRAPEERIRAQPSVTPAAQSRSAPKASLGAPSRSKNRTAARPAATLPHEAASTHDDNWNSF